jgi:hypothetical protein
MATRRVGKLVIKKFDPLESLKKPFTMVLLGRRFTGKSTTMKDILYNLNMLNYPRIVVFSGTEESNHFFSSCVPTCYIHHQLNLETLASIIATQRQIVSAVRDVEAKLGRSCNIDTRLVLVFDDCVYQKNVLQNEHFRYIFFQGRHVHISIILSQQYLMYLPVEARGNVDFLICMRENIPKNRVKLYESFFGCFEDKATFFAALDQLTQNYECLILDNTGTTLNPEHMCRWYRATHPLPTFKFKIVGKFS